jgi:transaldolase / glucose-6-phosphate isomerase
MSDAAITIEARIPDSLAAAVTDAARVAVDERVAQRVRDADASLWGPTTGSAPEIANRLGWLTIARRMLQQVPELEDFAEQVRGEGVRDVVLLGMGGSSLAPEVLRRCFAPRPGYPTLHVLDSTDAATVREVTEQIEVQRTLFLVSSKSGGTIEPLSLFAHFFSLRSDGGAFAAITDPGTELERLAGEHGFRRVFAGDPEIGGRYSALSAFGMVPAALIGVDVAGLLEGAEAAWETPLGADVAATGELPAPVWLGATLAALARAGRDKLTFMISEQLPGLGLWLEQLVAESTGKQDRGILPVAEEPLAEAERYGSDRVFAFLTDLGSEPEQVGQLVRGLAEAGHPVLTVPTRGAADLGRVFLLWEIAVAVAGWGLQINPFDQPNVQQAKDATKRMLEEYERRGKLPEAPDAGAGALRALLGEASPPPYVAILGYVPASAQFEAAVARLRSAIIAGCGATTTFGYGPRYLHSTGQFHKGGPPLGRFLQLLADRMPDVEIPGAPYTFTTLKNAQAAGDLNTLRELGLPAERLRLTGDDPAAGVLALADSIDPSARRTP